MNRVIDRERARKERGKERERESEKIERDRVRTRNRERKMSILWDHIWTGGERIPIELTKRRAAV